VDDLPVERLLWGVAAGSAALAVSLGLSIVVARARRTDRRPPDVGLPMAMAAVIAIAPWRAPTVGVIVGLAGVTATVALAASMHRRSEPAPVVPTLILAAPFAWLVVVDASPIGWVRAVGLCGVAFGAVAASRTDREWGPAGLTPGLYAITAAGVFAAVPNTKGAVALLGAALPGALAGWPLGRARLGIAGAASATAVLAWTAAVGASGREPAIVGALACLGVLATRPVGSWLAAHGLGTAVRRRPRWLPGALPVLIVHTAAVAVASRVAGISDDLHLAVPVALETLVAASIASAVLTGGPARADQLRAEALPATNARGGWGSAAGRTR
jgi:hypothetical protein